MEEMEVELPPVFTVCGEEQPTQRVTTRALGQDKCPLPWRALSRSVWLSNRRASTPLTPRHDAWFARRPVRHRHLGKPHAEDTQELLVIPPGTWG